MNRTGRGLLLVAAAAATIALAIGLRSADFLPPDEARVAEVAREMAEGGGWLVPRLNVKPFLEEPPLFYWMQAIGFRLAGGPSTGMARVPAAAAAIVGVLVAAQLGAVLGAEAGLVAIVLATSPEWWWMARSATPDAAAAAAVVLSLALFFRAWRDGRRTMLAGSAVALGVAFWCKSFLPVGLEVIAAGTFIAMAGRGRLSWRAIAAALASAALVSGVWIVIMAWVLGRDAVTFFVVANHMHRLVGHGEGGHVRPWLYYLPNLALDLFPWSLVLPAALVSAWRARAAPERMFPLVCAATMTLVLSASATKRAHYLLPAYPAFAILVAQWWPASWGHPIANSVRRLMVGIVAVVAPVVTFLLLAVDPTRAIAASHSASRGDLVSDLLAAIVPRPTAWVLGGAVLALGGVVLATECRSRQAELAASLAVVLTAVHLVVVQVTLPAIDPLVSARPWAERLARLAGEGTPVLVFGFRESEQLSPFMFYARRCFETVADTEALAIRLRAAPACVLFRSEDYAELAGAVPGTPVVHDTLGPFPLVLVETQPGLCQAALAPTQNTLRRETALEQGFDCDPTPHQGRG
jgi:4-amino-4-deoxy-L-arabinose transferase-like glycosyltransferase